MPAPASSGETGLGTRFRIYPQAPYVPGYGTPETVWISDDPASLQAGPADSRIYVRDPVQEKEPYEFPYLPPYTGLANPPAVAGPDGHFDQIPEGRQFVSAHAFAAVRRVLDIWESYLGRNIPWHFAATYERLEIIPYLDWENAQSGFGFLELGVDHAPDGSIYPLALNFDAIAHEMGHAILFSLMGLPEDGAYTPDFGAFHEASADLVSLVSFLHFDTGLDRLLRHCRGNLLTLNELNRIVELSGERQIRLASNSRRMSEVSNDVHDRSRPFTGAVFDTIAETFHEILVKEGLADARLLEIDMRDIDAAALDRISELTATSYAASPLRFKSALERARDEIGLVLVRTWDRLEPYGLTFQDVADAVLRAAETQGTVLSARFEENFQWRDII